MRKAISRLKLIPLAMIAIIFIFSFLVIRSSGQPPIPFGNFGFDSQLSLMFTIFFLLSIADLGLIYFFLIRSKDGFREAINAYALTQIPMIFGMVVALTAMNIMFIYPFMAISIAYYWHVNKRIGSNADA